MSDASSHDVAEQPVGQWPLDGVGRSAVVLLSGGLDSATALAIARRRGFTCHAITFDYGQRHRIELMAACAIAKQMGVVEHRLIRIDLKAFGRSALTDLELAVPKDRPESQMAHQGIPITYVPARNTIFLSYALALAEVLCSGDLFLGVNALDYSGYPDCRPAFIQAFEDMANLATQAGVEAKEEYDRRWLTIHAPLLHWSKVRIIQQGLALGVDYALTHSCYDPQADGQPCLRCDSCRLRQKAFRELGTVDPLLTRWSPEDEG